ncbi:hypothetical protein JIN77_07325 [Verrucomicrobiaceae bacterium R5-34]|nr:hypothetical protein [Verrucomicrobiaceae bacterium R5-34]
MWIEIPNIWIAVINTLGIPATHLVIAWSSTRLPQRWFQRTPEATTEKREFQQILLERIFLVRRWKKHLPDAAPMFRGFPKARMQSKEPDYLRNFIAETRRGEFSHWLQMVAISIFIIWTPWPGNLIVILWAIISNLPCIINLRHTRQRMRNLLHTLTPS